MFTLWVESFDTSYTTGSCDVHSIRDTTQDDDYDFFIWYFPSDCTDQSDEVKFRKGKRFWGKFAFEYIGDMTDRTKADNRGKREFDLSTEDG